MPSHKHLGVVFMLDSPSSSTSLASRPFRVLALDGGGVRGAFSAAVLAALERETGRSCVEHFDLIVGTSTGGIIALALAMGFTAEEAAQFYVKYGDQIFPSTGVLRRAAGVLRWLVAPKRTRADLADALSAVFGERLLGEARRPVVLPCYDAVGGRIYLLKTAHHGRFTREYRARVVDCALATSAAPTYFAASPFPAHRGASYVDGGVWANCPALVGVTEAVHFFGVPPTAVDVLSIGTVGAPFAISEQRRRGGVAQWNLAMLELLLRGQAETALAQATLLTNGGVYRIDQTVARGQFAMDDARGLGDLLVLGENEGVKRAHIDAVSTRFLNGVVAHPFSPEHALEAAENGDAPLPPHEAQLRKPS
jgi:predicted acylesterase/phospholipase RssA